MMPKHSVSAILAAMAALLLAGTGCEKDKPSTEGQTAGKPAPAETTPTATAEQPSATATAAAEQPAHECSGACEGEGKHQGEHACGNGENCGGGCDQSDEAAAEVTAREVPEDSSWTDLAVEGMHCGGCERRIIANVGSVDGVLAVEADHKTGQVRIAVAPKNDTAKSAAIDKIKSLGFRIQ